jgi:DNA-binding NarL/FixJ family response regulator
LLHSITGFCFTQTTAEIAKALGNSVKTIDNHRSHICQKLGLHGPQALLRFALEHKALLE